jgi:hypothetical protein
VNIKKRICLCLANLLLALAPTSSVAGVTIITHGYSGNVDGWVTGMANRIPNYPGFPGTNASVYKLTLTYNGASYFYQWSLVLGSPLTDIDSGEIIVKLDWSQLAGGSGTYDRSTYNVASVATQALEQTNTFFGGHALTEFPIHLIGHSRGGSLVTEISRLLGGDGIWVDQLTTLDPHPFNNDGNFDPFFPTDATALPAYVNVLYRDNYWQNLGTFLDPDGEAVSGAYNRQLSNLSGGYHNVSSSSPYHSNVHLWYHGTLDGRNPASDTEAQITSAEYNSWYVPYEQAGGRAGLKWGLLGGGDRTSTDQPLGPGFPAISDGYNKWWNLGAGTAANRSALTANSGAWPNIIKFELLGTNSVTAGTLVSMRYYFQFGQSLSATAAVQIFLDGDANPLDGDSGQIFSQTENGTGTSGMVFRTFPFNSTNTPPGQYYVFSKITFGGHTRYLRAPGKLTILPSLETAPPVLTAQKLGSTIVLQWATNASGFALQWSTNLSNINWSDATTAPMIVGTNFSVTDDLSNLFRVYRLKK